MLPPFGSRRSKASPAPLSKKFRPRLEGLECREVPAAVYWQGDVNSSALEPLNWSGDALPGISDDVYFSGSTTPDCSGLGGYFNSLHLVNGYAGTVTLGSNTGGREFEMTSGAIAQPSPTHTTLYFYDKFTWTGGVLNSTATRSLVSLIGVEQALIDPPDGSALVTGSTIVFQDDNGLIGSTGTVTAGTVVWNNDAYYSIDALSEVVFDLTNGDLNFVNSGVNSDANDGRHVLLDNSGTGLNTHTTRNPYSNTEHLIIKDDILFFLDTPTDIATKSYTQTSTAPPGEPVPRTEMYTGTKMWGTNGMAFLGGRLDIRPQTGNKVEFEGNTAFGPEGVEEGAWFLVYFSGQLLNPDNDCDNYIRVVGNLTVHYTEFDINYKPGVPDTSNYVEVSGTLHYFGDSKGL